MFISLMNLRVMEEYMDVQKTVFFKPLNSVSKGETLLNEKSLIKGRSLK